MSNINWSYSEQKRELIFLHSSFALVLPEELRNVATVKEELTTYDSVFDGGQLIFVVVVILIFVIIVWKRKTLS